ncbi:hypothetical protein [Yinghuangia soli]|uniref:Uncharacterized protein n=1 Tax=Yinghuangia soli TaxID=2908204 RepID=A0AA41Q281_9ACTN|nr:hypothetical protein [Yinghuangia soli]MCF2530228.1 hypothetical protein [Yinghuangia soli]
MTAKTRARETPAPAKRPISITAVVDCVGVLATGSMSGQLYLYDTNKAGGSAGFGTEELQTKAAVGDKLLWNCLALECEAYVGIDAVVIDPEVCEPERKVYPGTDVAYWTGIVKKLPAEPVPYEIRFLVGTRAQSVPTTLSPTLTG